MSRINIKDVAKYAGVSTMTVTRVLNTPELVKEETRSKVLDAIKQLGYIPNYTASVLRTSKSGTIGITIFDIENPFMSRLVMELEKNLKKYNYRLLITFANEADVDDYEIYAKLKIFNVDTVLFVPTSKCENMSELPLEQSSKCLQLFRNVYENIDSLTINDIYGSYLATKHLLQNGHRDIMLIDYEQRIPLNRDRGYVQAFKEFGQAVNPDMFIRLNEFSEAGYVEPIMKAIETHKPSAILAVTQKLCADTLSAMGKLGLKIKDDISLIGYDDTKISQYLDITTIAHPFEEIVEKITQIVVNKLNSTNVSTTTHICVNPFLIVRSSVKNIS